MSRPGAKVATVLAVAAVVVAAPAGATACEAKLLPNPLRQSVAAVETPSHLVVGVDGGYGSWGSCEVRARARLGAAVTRHEWQPEERVRAQDNLVLTAAKRVHTRIEALLGANSLGNSKHYREFVIAFIRRYGEGGSFWREHPGLDASRYAIQTFELGNEPYYAGVSAEQYAATVRPTLEAVRRLHLPGQLVLPSRVYGDDVTWAQTLYREIPDLNDLFGGFAEHPYWYGHSPAAGGPASPFGRIATLRQEMNARGASSKPILITEYGESTARCGDECTNEANQAQHLRLMINALARHPEWGVSTIDVYQLIDRGTDTSDRELQFGLLRQDGRPKQSWKVVRELAARYRG